MQNPASQGQGISNCKLFFTVQAGGQGDKKSLLSCDSSCLLAPGRRFQTTPSRSLRQQSITFSCVVAIDKVAVFRLAMNPDAYEKVEACRVNMDDIGDARLFRGKCESWIPQQRRNAGTSKSEEHREYHPTRGYTLQTGEGHWPNLFAICMES